MTSLHHLSWIVIIPHLISIIPIHPLLCVFLNPQPPEDSVVGGLDVEDTELCDDVERVRTHWEFGRARGTGFAPVKTIDG